MDPVSIVVAALVAGATAGVSGAATTAVTDAYQALKTLVIGRLRRGGVDDDTAQQLIERAGDHADRFAAMKSELARVEVDDPTVEAAERLLELLKDKGKFHVTLHDAKGVIVGDHATQHNTFN